MEKKILTWYEAPEVEIIEAEVEAQLLAGSNPLDPDEDAVPDDEKVE
jgi:hypothetical protein